MENIHKGHRERMRQRFLRHGLENFDDVNALELLLFYALPRQDTNPAAHALLRRFGSLDAVLDASAQELESVPGIGENATALLRLIPAMAQRYLVRKTPENEPVNTPTRAGRYFVPRFLGERDEVVLALFLDAHGCPLRCVELGRGSVSETQLSTRRIASLALEYRAGSVILAHNHPAGVALPSAEDESSTRVLAQALALLGVKLSDHVIVAGSEYTSMRECGLLR